MMELIELVLRCMTGLLLLTTMVFVIGIVWRVEAELDIAYKWFTLAVIFFFVSEVLDLLPSVETTSLGGVIFAATHLFAVGALFLGMYYMRDLVRRMDGEKQEERPNS